MNGYWRGRQKFYTDPGFLIPWALFMLLAAALFHYWNPPIWVAFLFGFLFPLFRFLVNRWVNKHYDHAELARRRADRHG